MQAEEKQQLYSTSKVEEEESKS